MFRDLTHKYRLAVQASYPNDLKPRSPNSELQVICFSPAARQAYPALLHHFPAFEKTAIFYTYSAVFLAGYVTHASSPVELSAQSVKFSPPPAW